MLKNSDKAGDLRQLLLYLLSASGTLAGLSMTVVGIVSLKVADTKVETLADDLFLFSSLGFLVVCYCVFFALRRLDLLNLRRWTNLIDVIFLASLTALVAGGFIVVYTFV